MKMPLTLGKMIKKDKKCSHLITETEKFLKMAKKTADFQRLFKNFDQN